MLKLTAVHSIRIRLARPGCDFSRSSTLTSGDANRVGSRNNYSFGQNWKTFHTTSKSCSRPLLSSQLIPRKRISLIYLRGQSYHDKLRLLERLLRRLEHQDGVHKIQSDLFRRHSSRHSTHVVPDSSNSNVTATTPLDSHIMEYEIPLSGVTSP